jgi:hypothetical protein
VNTVPSEYEAAWQPRSGTIGIDISWESGKPAYESEFVARRSVINHVKAEKMKYFSIQCSPISGGGGGMLFGRFRGFAHLSFG